MSGASSLAPVLPGRLVETEETATKDAPTAMLAIRVAVAPAPRTSVISEQAAIGVSRVFLPQERRVWSLADAVQLHALGVRQSLRLRLAHDPSSVK
jgi:hypothetical protein